MPVTHLEAEAQHYWSNAKRLRLTSGLTADRVDATDELAVISQYSEHPVIRRDVARLLGTEQAGAAKC